MKPYIIGIVAIVILGLLLFLVGQSSGKNSPATAKVASILTSEESFYDFGEIGIFDGKVTKDFTLTNTGDELITILNGTTSCGCTEGSIDGVIFGMHEDMARTVSLEPKESKTLTAIYDPLAHGPDAVGQVTRQLFLKTNSTETPELEIKISANIVKGE